MSAPFKIVAVDDERASLELISHALSFSRLPIDLIRFPDAETALEYLRTTHVDLVVTDLRMPRMDGREFIREFREIDRTTPIVVASSEPISTGEALALGASAFVPKAALNDQLAAAVSELIALHHLHRRLKSLKTSRKIAHHAVG